MPGLREELDANLYPRDEDLPDEAGFSEDDDSDEVDDDFLPDNDEDNDE